MMNSILKALVVQAQENYRANFTSNRFSPGDKIRYQDGLVQEVVGTSPHARETVYVMTTLQHGKRQVQKINVEALGLVKV